MKNPAIRYNVPSVQSIQRGMDKLRSDYQMTRPSRFRKNRRDIPSTGASADYHVRSQTDWLFMIEDARALERDNMVFGAALNRVVANVIQDGFSLDVETGDTELDKHLLDRWNQWADDKYKCDFNREKTFYDMERLVCRQPIVDGDIFAIPDESGSIRLLEAHRCRTPSNTRKNVVNGVEKDEQRRLLAYWFTKFDISPSTRFSRVRDVEKIDAFDDNGQPNVFHILDRKRTSASRGVTAVAPIFDPVGFHDDIQFAKLVQQQMVSAFALIHNYENGAPPPPPDDEADRHGEDYPEATNADGSSRNQQGMAPALEYWADEGETLTAFSPNIPNPEFFQQAMMILAIIAINLDLPLIALLLDGKQTNFSGWRGAMDQARMSFKQIQKRIRQQFHSPIYRWRVAEIFRTTPDLERFIGRDDVDIFGHRWNAPRWSYIEPVKDAQANKIRVDERQASGPQVASENGVNYDEMREQQLRANAKEIRTAIDLAAEINVDKQDKLKAMGSPPITWQNVDVLITASNHSSTESKSIAQTLIEEDDETVSTTANGESE